MRRGASLVLLEGKCRSCGNEGGGRGARGEANETRCERARGPRLGETKVGARCEGGVTLRDYDDRRSAHYRVSMPPLQHIPAASETSSSPPPEIVRTPGLPSSILSLISCIRFASKPVFIHPRWHIGPLTLNAKSLDSSATVAILTGLCNLLPLLLSQYLFS